MALQKVTEEDANSADQTTENQDLHKEEDVFSTKTTENEPVVSEDLAVKEELETKEEQKEDLPKSKLVPVQQPSMPLHEVEKMIDNMNQKFEEKLARMFATQAGKADIASDEKYVSDLMEDWNDVPALFFAYSHEFRISGDKRKGVEHTPPHGTIKFKPLIRTHKKTGKGTQVISVSSVKVHSKKEIEFLRSHSQFGIRFFESMQNAMTVDISWSQKLVESNQSIQQLSDTQVIDRCKQEGVDIIPDIVLLRKNLVEHIAKKNIAHEERLRNSGLRNSIKDTQTGRVIEEKTIG